MFRSTALSLALFLLILGNIQAQESSPFNIVGIWQDAPSIGSGWSENYQIFEDGRIRFNHNQMDCGDSLITESGTYTFKNGALKIKIDSLTFISGGTLQKSTGSCGSEYELVGGEITTKSFKRKFKLKIQQVPPLEDYDFLDRIIIEEVNWFRMAHNPNDY